MSGIELDQFINFIMNTKEQKVLDDQLRTECGQLT